MINLSTEESQVTEKSLKLRGFSEDIDLVKSRSLPINRLNPIVDEVDGWIKDGDLNLFDKMMSYYILGHCYNSRRQLTLDPAKANYNDLQIWKEVFCYRASLHLAKEVGNRKLMLYIELLSRCGIRLLFTLLLYMTTSDAFKRHNICGCKLGI